MRANGSRSHAARVPQSPGCPHNAAIWTAALTQQCCQGSKPSLGRFRTRATRSMAGPTRTAGHKPHISRVHSALLGQRSDPTPGPRNSTSRGVAVEKYASLSLTVLRWGQAPLPSAHAPPEGPQAPLLKPRPGRQGTDARQARKILAATQRTSLAPDRTRTRPPPLRTCRCGRAGAW